MGDANGPSERPSGSRKAAVVVVPLCILGIANVLLILQWDMNPVWGALLVPPVLFISVLGWIAIEGGIAGDRSGVE